MKTIHLLNVKTTIYLQQSIGKKIEQKPTKTDKAENIYK